MPLSEYVKAIALMRKFFNGEESYFTSISCSWDGVAYIFKTGDPDTSYFVVFPNKNIVEIRFADTWRNPDHKEVYDLNEKPELPTAEDWEAFWRENY